MIETKFPKLTRISRFSHLIDRQGRTQKKCLLSFRSLGSLSEKACCQGSGVANKRGMNCCHYSYSLDFWNLAQQDQSPGCCIGNIILRMASTFQPLVRPIMSGLEEENSRCENWLAYVQSTIQYCALQSLLRGSTSL